MKKTDPLTAVKELEEFGHATPKIDVRAFSFRHQPSPAAGGERVASAKMFVLRLGLLQTVFIGSDLQTFVGGEQKDMLPCGVMVTQRPLEPLFMVRVHAGQPSAEYQQDGMTKARSGEQHGGGARAAFLFTS